MSGSTINSGVFGGWYTGVGAGGMYEGGVYVVVAATATWETVAACCCESKGDTGKHRIAFSFVPSAGSLHSVVLREYWSQPVSCNSGLSACSVRSEPGLILLTHAQELLLFRQPVQLGQQLLLTPLPLFNLWSSGSRARHQSGTQAPACTPWGLSQVPLAHTHLL